MKKKGKLTKVERSEISILLERRCSLREIAKALDRSPNTISYEIRENSVSGAYDPVKADAKAGADRKYRRLQWRKIEHDPLLREYVIEKLGMHWNPDEISGAMRKTKTPFYASKTAIYEWLRSVWGQRYCPLLYSKRYRRKKRVPKTKRVTIPERISIFERPMGAINRSRYGHFEADALVSCRGGSGAFAVVSERKSKLIMARRVSSLSPVVYAHSLREMMDETKVKSITFDNGMENRKHLELGVPTYFCDPYSSWQKGGVENANKMIRRYVPKGTDLSLITQSYLDHIVSIINAKPRKSLGYRSALEVATSAGVLLGNRLQVS